MKPHRTPSRRRRKAGRVTGPLPRAPLPRQVGGVHEDKSKRPPRKRKHKKRPDENE